jgi:LDH2 family malate/lactate/ureidoglycolate dehydrogenase
VAPAERGLLTRRSHRVGWSALRRFCEDVLAAAGLPRPDAEVVADSLVHADLAGLPSHGVARLGGYLTRMEGGLVEKTTEIDTVTETATTAVLDANNGWGQVASRRAVEVAVGKARRWGSAWVGVRNSNHYGTAGYWTARIAAEGLVGISCTNGTPLMAPFGGRHPSLGTNPISVAVPSRSGRPVVLDMSTSAQARGKILLAARSGEPIPAGWAITRDGRPTTDAAEAREGCLLPLAGPKGSGLALMVDVLSGVLTGANFGGEMPRMYEDPEPQRLGHLFAALDVGAMMPPDEFLARMDERERETREGPPAVGFDEVLMPGDLEHRKAEENRRSGVPLSEEVRRELVEVAARYRVPAGILE